MKTTNHSIYYDYTRIIVLFINFSNFLMVSFQFQSNPANPCKIRILQLENWKNHPFSNHFPTYFPTVFQNLLPFITYFSIIHTDVLLQEKKVFISGAGGFIGSHLAQKLLSSGADVTCFLRYTSSSSIGNLKFISKALFENVRIEYGDIRDHERLKTLLSGHVIVFHLASSISIPYSYLGIRDVVSTNIDGTLSMLLAAKKIGIERFIHTSTSEVYGSGQYFPMDEKHPLCAQSPYAASKIAADKLAESFYRSYDLPVIIVKPFNTYGPRQSARAIIPTIITQALKNEKIVLGDISPKRDFTFVTDTVSGFIIAAESKSAIGEVLNLGTGVDISIEALCQMICKTIGVKKQIEKAKARVRPTMSEVIRLQADYSKVKTLVGYSPEVNLEDGLKKTVDFFRENISPNTKDIYNF